MINVIRVLITNSSKDLLNPDYLWTAVIDKKPFRVFGYGNTPAEAVQSLMDEHAMLEMSEKKDTYDD